MIVIGAPGSGKSTTSKQLAKALDAPRFSLDNIYWAAGDGRPIPDTEFVSTVDQITRGDRWIVDGVYKQVRSMAWDRATAILWLNYSFPRVYRQVMGRTFRWLRKKTANSRLTIREAFFHRHSPWFKVPATFRKLRREYRELFTNDVSSDRILIEHRTPAETQRLLDSLGP